MYASHAYAISTDADTILQRRLARPRLRDRLRMHLTLRPA